MGAWLRRIRGRGPHGGCRVTLDTERPLHPAPLQDLSLSKDVRPFSNEERMAALRQFLPVEFANSLFQFKPGE